MAQSIIGKLMVAVSSVGLGKTKADVDNLGKSTQNVNQAQAQAAKTGREYFNVQEKGIIGTANSTKSFSKLSQTIGSGSSGVVGAYATLAANIFAVTAAFGALRSAAQVEQVTLGLEALGSRTGQSLKLAAEGLREVTGATVSMEESMRSTAQVLSAGFNTEELHAIGAVANDVSVALGRNMTDSMQRLTRGIIKLEPELLDELGIMTRLDEATSKYAIQLGKSASALTATEKRQAFYNAVIEEGTLKFGDLSKAAGETRGYDKLNATISDLTKETLNFVNIAALPIANFFASSPTALVGVALLFAATLKNQLLPGMTDFAQKSADLSEALNKGVKKEIDEVIVSSKQFGENPVPGLDKLGTKIENGTVQLKDYKATLAEVRAEESKLAAIQARSAKTEQKGNPTIEQSLNHNERADRIRNLRDADQELVDVIVAQHSANGKLQESNAIVAGSQGKLTTAAGHLRAAYHQNVAAAIEAGEADKKFGAGLSNTTGSIGAFINELRGKGEATKATTEAIQVAEKANKGYGLSLIKLRATMVTTIGVVKVLGAAFLNAIPIIGQIIFALGLLVAGFNFLKNALTSKEQKEYNKTLKEFDTIIKSVADKSSEYARISSATASAALRQQQAFNIVGNTAKELGEKLGELIKLQEELDNKKFGAKKVKTVIEENPNGPRKNDKGPGAEILRELAKFDSPEVQKAISEGLKDIDQKALKSANRAGRNKIFNEVAKQVTGDLQTLGLVTEETANAFKTADDAASKFITSLSITTSFDQLSISLNGINNALLAQQGLAFSSGVAMDAYLTSISGIGPNLQKLLTVDSNKAINDFRQLDTTIQTISGIAEASRTEAQVKQLAIAKEQIGPAKEKLVLVGREIRETEKVVGALRNQERLSKSVLALEKARVAAIAELFEGSSAGVAARIQAEERMLNLQQQQLGFQNQINSRILENNKPLTEEERLGLQRAEAENEILLIKAAQGELSEKEMIRGQQLNTLITERRGREQASLEASVAVQDIQLQSAIIEEGRLTSAEKMAVIRSQEIKDQITLINLNRTLEKSIVKNATLEFELERLIQGRAETYEDQLQVSRLTYRESLKDLDIQFKNDKLSRDDLINRTRALATRANLTAAERTAAGARITNLQNEQRLATETYAQEKRSLELSERRDRLALVSFDARTGGIQMQQESLTLLERELELSQEILDSRISQVETEANLGARRRGLELSPEAVKALEIDAATTKLSLAREEATLRKTMIDLEFALIDGQRQILTAQLQSQRTEIAAQVGQEDPRVRQIDATLDNLERVSLDSVKNLAKAAIDASLGAQTSALAALRDSSSVVNNPVNNMISAFEGVAGIIASRQAADTVLAEKVKKDAIDVVHTASSEVLPAILSPMDRAVTQLEIIAERLDEMLAATTNSGSLGGAASSGEDAVQQVGRMLQQRGLRVSEQSEFGGIQAQHRGRGHAENRAIDVNVGRGNVEWNNPAQKAQFDALKIELEAMGARVLWGVAGHFNHMHVEFPKGFTRVAEAVQAVERAVEAAPAPVAVQASAAVMPSANDNSDPATDLGEIVVTANRTKKKVNQEARTTFNDTLAYIKVGIDQYRSSLMALGPQGELVLAVADGATAMADSLKKTFDVLTNPKADPREKFLAVTSTISSAISSIMAIQAASSAARVAGIDKEIAAEQKRDGKSSESVAKIQSLERKKDAVQRKSFETNKKLMMAQTIVSTAAAIAGALAVQPFPVGLALAGVAGVMGAAQLAIIAGTSYQSTSGSNAAASTSPTTLSIGKRGDSVDLAKSNTNAGGEIGYLRGAQGRGSNASNYSVIGSAYGGSMPRGYGSTSFAIGEKGPEIITPDVPMTVRPMNSSEMSGGTPQAVSFNINALDAKGVEEILHGQRGNIIGMLREAANANGQSFLEDVDVNVYTRPNVGRL